MEVVVSAEDHPVDGGQRVEIYGQDGHRHDIFGSHRDMIELAVFHNVLGSRDMPFEYSGQTDSRGKHTDGSQLKELILLNPNHTHYLAVDDGSNGSFGTEQAFRAELETFISYYDADARGLTLARLTDYFSHCIDESALQIGDHVVRGSNQTHVLPLNRFSRQSIDVLRTASDGTTRHQYRLNIFKEAEQEATQQIKAEQDRQDTLAGLVSSMFGDPWTDASDIVGIKVAAHNQRTLSTSPSASASATSEQGLAFHPATLEYDVKVPLDTQAVTITVLTSSATKKVYKASVPVVTLCYGGGPGTLNTLTSAGRKPIIVVRGSERSAKFIEDWLSWEQRKADAIKVAELKVTNKQEWHAKLASINTTFKELQLEEARRSLRGDACAFQRPPTTYEDVAALEVKPQWWDVSSNVDKLEKLGKHNHLRFFDIKQNMSSRTTGRTGLNPMLPTLLDGVINSTEVKITVKMSLAIRLNDEAYVEALCDAHGLKLGHDHPCVDGRPLVFAAFHDQGKVVDRLLDASFDLTQLDQLAMAEIQCALDEPRLLKGNVPPDWWSQAQYKELGLKPDDDTNIVASRWRKLSVEEKKTVYRTISWTMMPRLSGWTYNVTTIDGDGRAITATLELASKERSEGWHMNMVMMLSECSYMDGERASNGLQRRTFVVVAPVNLAGKKFTAQDVKLAAEDGTLTCVFDTGKAKVHARLKPNYRDNVTEWLPLDRESKFHFPWQVEEERTVHRSFFHWLPRHEDESEGGAATEPNRPWHDLHRLYWAVRSDRPQLAAVLMHRCKLPIVAGLFGCYLYNTQKPKRTAVADARTEVGHSPAQMRVRFEEYAVRILNEAFMGESTAAFDQYLFYGIDEEDGVTYRTFMHKRRSQIENTILRDALQLMGIPAETEVTHIDLALRANAKLFMSQRGVKQFLTRLFKGPAVSDKYCSRLAAQHLKVSPRIKGWVHSAGFALFLAIVTSFIFSLPAHDKAIESITAVEVVFWLWVLAYVLHEIDSATGDLGLTRQSVRDYLKGIGNTLDAVIVTVFLATFVARVWHAFSQKGGSSLAILAALLNSNLWLCWIRFLYKLAMFDRIGTMTVRVILCPHSDCHLSCISYI